MCMPQFKLLMNWNQEELEQWSLAQQQKEEDNQALDKYRCERHHGNTTAQQVLLLCNRCHTAQLAVAANRRGFASTLTWRHQQAAAL